MRFEVILTVLLAAAGPASGDEWEFEPVVPGVFFDMAVASDGTPHIIFTNCTHLEDCFGSPAPRALVHGVQQGVSWSFDTLSLDPAGFTPAITLDDSGRVHVVYVDSLLDLQYLRGSPGGPWTPESLLHTGPNYFRNEPDIAVDDTGGVHVSYNERERLWYQYRSSSGWTEEQVSFDYADNDIARSSIAVGSVVRVAFWSFASWGVIHELSGGLWMEDVIGGDMGQFPSLALDATGASHVLYTGNNGVSYATDQSGSWVETTLDEDGKYGDLILSPAGVPVVVYPVAVAKIDTEIYYDVDLYLSVRVDSFWQRQSLVSYRTPAVGGVGAIFRPRLACDAAAMLHLAYADPATDVLMYARSPFPTAVARRPSTPAPLELRAVPNPFNPSTTIHYSTALPGRVRLEVFDARGRRLQVLVDTNLPPGPHRAMWDGVSEEGGRVSSGVYFLRLSAPSASVSRRVTLLK